MRSTIGTPKASVLPDPVGDCASTSWPASTSGMTMLLDGERLCDPALGELACDDLGHAEVGE